MQLISQSQLKILLAGFGDLGSRLASRLAKKGVELTAVKRGPLKGEVGFLLRKGDLRDSFFLKILLFERYDVIVVSITPDEFSDRGYRDSYVVVAENLAEAITGNTVKPGLVLWVSSTGVYGDGKGEWVDEQTEPVPTSFSGRRLLEAEQIIKSLPVPFAIVRFSGIYGPGRNRMLEQVKQGKIAAAEPMVWSNRIHSEDCAGVLEHLIALHQSGRRLEQVYIATDSNPAPVYEVQNWLADQLGVVARQETAPAARANRRCSNRRLLASGYQFLYPDYRSGYGELLRTS